MPEIMSLGLFERGGRTLVARRKADEPPFAEQTLLPGVVAGDSDAMEEALEGHLYRELGVETRGALEFADTLYLEDQGRRYVANVFRVRGHRGQLRFRAAGCYADARWLAKPELAEVVMPEALRSWLAGGRKPEFSGPVAVPAVGLAPDNRVAWNAISRAYQERYRLPADRIVYDDPWDEPALGLLGEVSGMRVLVVGCGGGQDCIALAKQGAQVTGLDVSDKQIEYGRRLAEREGVVITLVQGNAEDLGRFDDESQDLVLSIHALNYVEHVDRTIAEAYRVLKPSGAFVFCVHHPFDASLENEPPYAVSKAYWQGALDWQWDFAEAGVSARTRSWYRPVSEWFALLTGASFRVERLLEPGPARSAGEEPSCDSGSRGEKSELVPKTLIVRAVKP
jgi:SAM-dependent methyltransferase